MAKIDGMMKKTDGVVKAEVLFNSSRVKAEIDESIVSTAQVKQRIEALGYKVLGEK
jgi:copper chaperone CopZ